MRDNRFTGAFGEFIAYVYFIVRGYRVRRNQRIAGVQVDLVVQKQGNIHVVEVKTRKNRVPNTKLVSTKQIKRLKTVCKSIAYQKDTNSVSLHVFVVYLWPFGLESYANVCDISD